MSSSASHGTKRKAEQILGSSTLSSSPAMGTMPATLAAASAAPNAFIAPMVPGATSHLLPSVAQPTPPSRKRRAPGVPLAAPAAVIEAIAADSDTLQSPSAAKKSRTNTPWTPAEEQRLKQMRDGGNSWSDIAKTFPNRTEGSVKKHWYKDMHYAEFAEDESAALLAAIKEYESSKWKVIGQKVGKPAKACEQYAKEHFFGKV